MKNWVTDLNIRITKIAETKWATSALFLCAFADAFLLPIPATTIFLILLLLNTKKAWKYVVSITLGTLTGAFAGYLLGHFAWLKPNGEFTAIAQFLYNHVPGFSEEIYDRVHVLYSRWDFWIVCAAAATPLPLSMFTIASGVFDLNIFAFLIATLISQSIKFTLIAIFAIKLSPNLRRLIEINWKPVAIVSSVSLVVAFVVVRVL
jgi:membrane protein YqaA with SNARE-associated domain